MNGIIFSGLMTVDHIKTIESLPNRSELSKIKSVQDCTGGLVPNTGIDFAVLDRSVPVQAYGAVGTDESGAFVIAQLQKYGIDTQHVVRRGITSFTDVYAETAVKARTFYQFGGVAATYSEEDVGVASLDCKIFHIGYLLLLDELDSEDDEYGTKMAHLLHHVQERGIKTSIDVVSESGDRFTRIVPPALKYVNYLIINEIEAEKTTGIPLRDGERLLAENMRPAIEKLFSFGVKDCVVIHTQEGAFAMDRNGAFETIASNHLPDGYIKGTVGAGDAFCAGALLALYRELPLKEIVKYGTSAAQVSLTHETATGGMISIEEALSEYEKYKK